jgi:hypothetical protein
VISYSIRKHHPSVVGNTDGHAVRCGGDVACGSPLNIRCTEIWTVIAPRIDNHVSSASYTLATSSHRIEKRNHQFCVAVTFYLSIKHRGRDANHYYWSREFHSSLYSPKSNVMGHLCIIKIFFWMYKVSSKTSCKLSTFDVPDRRQCIPVQCL